MPNNQAYLFQHITNCNDLSVVLALKVLFFYCPSVSWFQKRLEREVDVRYDAWDRRSSMALCLFRGKRVAQQTTALKKAVSHLRWSINQQLLSQCFNRCYLCSLFLATFFSFLCRKFWALYFLMVLCGYFFCSFISLSVLFMFIFVLHFLLHLALGHETHNVFFLSSIPHPMIGLFAFYIIEQRMLHLEQQLLIVPFTFIIEND